MAKKKEKIVILDSSSLITLTMNGLENTLEKFKTHSKIRFFITKDVKYEIIDKPSKIKRYKLESLKMRNLLENGTLEMPSAIGIKNKEINKKTKEILEKTNNSYFAKGEPMELIHDGEASCLALSLLADEKGLENVISADERTVRMFGENQENLRKLLQKKLHTRIELKKKKFIKNIRFIRSSEIIYIAYKRGIIDIEGEKTNVVESLMYAAKYKGCSISNSEIKIIKRISRT